MDRITRDQMLMSMAHIASQRGTCNRLKVGAVIAYESRPISIGYNGAPPGRRHCRSECNKYNPCKNTLHAEQNAINWAAKYRVMLRGSTLYVTDSPCMECAKLIHGSGIVRLVYDRPYRISAPLEWLCSRGIEIVKCFGVHNG